MQRIFDDGKIEEFTSKLDKKEPELPVLRGGAWGGGQDDTRCVYRVGYYPDFKGRDIGFRCARTITL
jgi:formylglycine-generating enzyme required for sulfatase activity